MRAADFGHALGTRGAVLTAILEEFDTRAIATAQEGEIADPRKRPCAELALHEGLIDLERAGPEHRHCSEDGLKEGDALFDIRHGDPDMMRTVYSFCHDAILAKLTAAKSLRRGAPADRQVATGRDEATRNTIPAHLRQSRERSGAADVQGRRRTYEPAAARHSISAAAFF